MFEQIEKNMRSMQVAACLIFVLVSLLSSVDGGPMCRCRNFHEQTMFCEHPDAPAAEFRVLEAIPGYWLSGRFVNNSEYEILQQQAHLNPWYYGGLYGYRGARYRIKMTKIYKGELQFSKNNSDWIQTEDQGKCEGHTLEVGATYIILGGGFVNKGVGLNNLWFYSTCDKLFPLSDLSQSDANWVRQNFASKYAVGCAECLVSDCRYAATCKLQGFWSSSNKVCQLTESHTEHWTSDSICLPDNQGCRWYTRDANEED